MRLATHLARGCQALKLILGTRRLRRFDPQEVERAELGFYIQFLRPGMVAFDVGANTGELSLLFSRLVGPTGRVHSFEASPETFARLKSIVDLAGNQNIQLNSCAVADRVGTVQLHIYDRQHAGWTTLADRPLANYGIDLVPVKTEAIESTTVDAYCEKNGINQIDLLKIDVEGAEYQVLWGTEKMLRERRVQCCVFEFGQTTFDMGVRPEQIQDILNRCGYAVENIIPGAPVFPGGDSSAKAQFSMHISRPRR